MTISQRAKKVGALVASLSGAAAKLYLLILMTGETDYSPREIALLIGCSKLTALKALEQLRLHGIVSHDQVKAAGYVYLCSVGDRFKIGVSTDPQKRVLRLDNASAHPIKLLHQIPADDPYEAESRLHQRYSTQQIRGEWFRLDEDDVTYIASIKAYRDGGWHFAAGGR